MKTTKLILLACVTLMLAGCSKEPPSTPSLSACFTPGEDCTQFVVDAIRLGQSEILVQAYNYTSPPILEALGKARTDGKLNVRVILDKSNEQPRYTGATYTRNHDIPVLIDSKVRIAHNKVMIIDRRHVLTGSFNFTMSAQKSNAENVLLVKDDPELAKRYIDNWNRRAAVSHEFTGPVEDSAVGRRRSGGREEE